MCRTYGQRPSAVLELTDPEVALDFDLAMSALHRAEVRSRVLEAVNKQGSAEVGTFSSVFELL